MRDAERLADKSLPSLLADAEGEVAAAFKGILKILMGKCEGGNEKRGGKALPKYLRKAVLRAELAESVYRAALWRAPRSSAAVPAAGLRASRPHTAEPRRYAVHGLLQELLQVSPVDQDYVIVFQELLEFGAGDDVVVALAPGGSVVGVIDRDGLQFGVVVAEVNDDFGDAGFQVLDGVGDRNRSSRWDGPKDRR